MHCKLLVDPFDSPSARLHADKFQTTQSKSVAKIIEVVPDFTHFKLSHNRPYVSHYSYSTQKHHAVLRIKSLQNGYTKISL